MRRRRLRLQFVFVPEWLLQRHRLHHPDPDGLRHQGRVVQRLQRDSSGWLHRGCLHLRWQCRLRQRATLRERHLRVRRNFLRQWMLLWNDLQFAQPFDLWIRRKSLRRLQFGDR